MATGNGTTLGAALVDLFHQAGRPGGPRASYRAVGWHAQVAQLTGTQAGREALEAAGVSVTRRTLTGWLSTEQTPTAANQAKIRQAYQITRGGFATSWTTAQYAITGRVTIGTDSRERGRYGTAPLRIDGRAGDWTHIQAEWNRSHPRPDTIESLFIDDVIVADLGETSEPWTFNGSRYSVSA